MLEVIQPGLQTTVQDIGRTGFISRGIAPAGAFDNFSFRIGNLLVGNQPGSPFLIGGENSEAGLEITLLGPKLRILDDLVIAITGADMSPVLNSEPVPMWTSIRLKKGDIISFGVTRRGARSYLCVAGGIDINLFLDSRSTFVKGQLGGFEGRSLKAGDKVRVIAPRVPLEALEGRALSNHIVPQFENRWTLRVILGPQDYLFKEESVNLFLETEWKASTTMDRMGVRLIGPKLHFKPRPDYLVQISGADPSNIISDTIPVGGIQVPSGIEPIICSVEGPGMGGYAKIATVISVDLSLVAQIRPMDIVVFKAVTTQEAIEALRQIEALISEANIVKRR